MQSVRNEFQRSHCILCLGLIRCFGEYHISISSVLLQRFSPTFGRALIPNFEVPCLKKHTGKCQLSKAFPFGQSSCFKKRSMLAAFPFLTDFFLSGPAFQGIRRGDVDGWSRTFSISFGLSLILLNRVSCHTYLPESIDLLLFVVRNLH